MADKGYIKISRRFFEHRYWNEPREYSRAEAWLDLIQSARFDSSIIILHSREIEVRRGEVVASRRYLEHRWLWGSTKVINFIENLKANQMITTRQTSGQTILTLCNYDDYNYSQASDQTTDKPVTNQRQTSDKPKIIKEKKVNTESKNPFIPKWGNSITPDSSESVFVDQNPIEEKRKKVAPKKEIDLSFASDAFRPIISRWLLYKSDKGQTYKSQDSLQTMYCKLLNFSNEDPALATEIIDNAIAQNYSGFFKIKQTNGIDKKSITPSDAELAQAVAEGISRARTPQEWEL